MNESKVFVIKSYFAKSIKATSWWLPLLFLVIYYAPGLFGRQVNVAPVYSWVLNDTHGANPELHNSDVTKGYFPYYMFARHVWESGASWEWNDTMFSGLPLWPEALYDLASPLQIVTLPFDPYFGFTLYQFLSSVLLIIFGNLLLSEFRLADWAKTLSIVVLVINGDSLIWLQHPGGFYYVWQFAACWTMAHVWRSGVKANWLKMGLVGGLFFGLNFYAPNLLSQATSLIAVTVFCFWLSILKPEGGLRLPEWKLWKAYLMMLIVGLGFGAAYWLPALENAGYSYRTVTAKDAFFPTYFRFMPYALRFDDMDYRNALVAWFGFEPLSHAFKEAIPTEKIPVIGWAFDGAYLSLTAFLLGLFAVINKTTRKQSAGIWLSLISMTIGYNLFAVVFKVGSIREFLLQFSILQSIYLNRIVATAFPFVFLLPGFGLCAFFEVMKKKLGKVLLLSWFGFIVIYTFGAFFITSRFKEALEQNLIRFMKQDSQNWSPLIINNLQLEVNRWLARLTPLPSMMIATIIILFFDLFILFLSFRYSLRRSVVVFALCTSFAISGIVVAYDRTGWTPAKTLVPQSKVIEFVKNQKELGRIYATRSTNSLAERLKQDVELRGVVDLSLGNYVRLMEHPLMPAMSMIYQLEDARGVSAFNLRDYRILLGGVKELPEDQPFTAPRMLSEMIGADPVHQRSWDLLNVRWIISPDDLEVPFYHLLMDDGELKVYENSHALPRVWFTGDAKVIADREKLGKFMTTPNWNTRQVLLEVQPTEVLPQEKTRYGLLSQEYVLRADQSNGWDYQRSLFARLWQPLVPYTQGDSLWESSPKAEADIQWIERKPGKLDVDVMANGNGWLVLSEIFYPGWKAQVDGKAWDIYRADYSLMAIPLESGKHRIEIEFRSDSTRVGVAISLFTLLGMIIITMVMFMIYRKKMVSPMKASK